MANGVVEGFDPARRVRLLPHEVRWRVLPRLLAELPKLQEEAVHARAKVTKAKRMAKGARLRERDPW